MKTTTEIKDQIVRKGASELIHSMLDEGLFFETEKQMRGWAEEVFDCNMLGQSPSNAEYNEIMDIYMGEVQDRVDEFFSFVYISIMEKAFHLQNSLKHDTSL